MKTAQGSVELHTHTHKSNICVTGVPEGEEKEGGAEKDWNK